MLIYRTGLNEFKVVEVPNISYFTQFSLNGEVIKDEQTQESFVYECCRYYYDVYICSYICFFIVITSLCISIQSVIFII